MVNLELTVVETATLYWVVRTEVKSPGFDDDPILGFSREAICGLLQRLEAVVDLDAASAAMGEGDNTS